MGKLRLGKIKEFDEGHQAIKDTDQEFGCSVSEPRYVFKSAQLHLIS